MSDTKMDATDAKAILLGKREEETRDVELPTLGVTVTVRALTRAEALRVVDRPMAPDEAERVLLSMALTNPLMSVDEVRQWQRVAPAGELQPVAEAIQQISGLGDAGAQVRAGIAGFRG
jgi:hypothetical protein